MHYLPLDLKQPNNNQSIDILMEKFEITNDLSQDIDKLCHIKIFKHDHHE